MSVPPFAVAKAVAADDDLQPAPIDPSWILEGTPVARSRSLGLNDDGRIQAMIWECTAGRFDWHYGDFDEIVHLLEGEIELTYPDGRVIRVTAGDVVRFEPNAIIRWHVPTYVKKVALYESKTSPIRRLAHRIPYARTVVQRLRSGRAGTMAILIGTLAALPVDRLGLLG